jgi:peroxiredoxin
MKKISKIFLCSAVILSSLLSVSPSYALKDYQSQKGLNVGEKISSFDLENDTGKIIKFDDTYKGKVLLLTVANYCNKDLAGVWTINSYYKFYKNKNFAFPFVFSRRCVPGYVPNFFVSQSANSTSTQVKIPYFLMDWDEEITKRFKGSKEDPIVYVVDKTGTIRYKEVLSTPFLSHEKIDKTISDLLNE